MNTTNTTSSSTATSNSVKPQWMQYVPQGSYLLTSSEVNILIQGINTFNGLPAVQISYSQGMASGIEDISNNNGNLYITPGNGNIPNPTQNGPFIPSGSFSIVTTNITVTVTALCTKENGQSVMSKVSFTQAQAATLKDIINVDGVLTLGF